MLKYWIYTLALFYFILFVHATDSVEDCDEDDWECLEDFTTSSSSSFITSSSSSFGEPLSTVSAAGNPDVLSDFHEAKLVKPKPDPNNPGGKERLPAKEDGSVQDKYNQDQDIDSGSAGLGDSIDESTATGLNKVEAGVLSACGILVVAGIAVGIFVWKNNTKRRNLRHQETSMADLEYNHDLDMNGGNPMMAKGEVMQPAKETSQQPMRQTDDIQSVKSAATSNSESLAIIQKQLQQEIEQEERFQLQQLRQQPAINLTLPAFERDEDDFFASWEQRNRRPSFQHKFSQQISEQHEAVLQVPKFEHVLFAPEESNPITSVRRPRAAEESKKADASQSNSTAAAGIDVSSTYHTPEVGKEYDMTNLSPGVQANTAPRPSALDPALDPTAITYPLQKFLNTPTQSFSKSPAQIPVELGDSDQDDDQNDTIKTSNTRQEAFGAMYTADKVGALSAPNLGQRLSKLLRQPDQLKTVSTAMVDIDLYQHTSKTAAAAAVARNEAQNGKQPFLSPLDLPDDQYIPMRDAAGPPLVSRAQILADPVRRLGQDEIALWEQKCRKKEPKRLSYEMWDEQLQRQEIEDIERYYGQQ
ncbi:hypothetical protein [Parasitella parasitica]|uniref:Uncharacterized protein n=1 Tax=Parasitella parasitica TaxID=35722 RepID=A0A0B7MYQ5_9FUNG|nr:hypothetical protein [Parasitella parasitica]